LAQNTRPRLVNLYMQFDTDLYGSHNLQIITSAEAWL
jgi:hypothetical protein